MNERVNLVEKLGLFDEHWQPKIGARINDNDVRIVKVKREFVWHKHNGTDDFFLVLKGHLTLQLRDRNVRTSPSASVCRLSSTCLAILPKRLENQIHAACETRHGLVSARARVT